VITHVANGTRDVPDSETSYQHSTSLAIICSRLHTVVNNDVFFFVNEPNGLELIDMGL
jgi:hypothetical protein